MRNYFIGGLVVLLMCTAMKSTQTLALYSTQEGQIKMTLALSIVTSTGKNLQAKSTIDTQTNAVRFSMQIKDFKFDNSFVENAFEDSYLEAAKYPEAVFEGKLKKAIDWNKKTVQEVEIAGNLTLHGNKKPKTITAKVMVVSASQVKVTSNFLVKASEHKIDISPSMFANGKDDIDLRLDATYYKK